MMAQTTTAPLIGGLVPFLRRLGISGMNIGNVRAAEIKLGHSADCCRTLCFSRR